MRYVETPADIEVKDRLWSSTEREIFFFAYRYADEHVVGKRYSKGQREVTRAAADKGYPITLIREVGSLIRRGMGSDPRLGEAISGYRRKIGL